MFHRIHSGLAALLACGAIAGAAELQPIVKVLAKPDLVREVLEGRRTEANAAWWGFDPDDATEALQAAINSGARRVVVPRMKSDWIVRPLRLASNQELHFERGVVVSAKRGEFKNVSDALLSAKDQENITITGRGATLRMHKADYIEGRHWFESKKERGFGGYERGEGRATLRLRGCRNVEVSGLTMLDSGGDGITIMGGAVTTHCENVVIRDVVCENHHRQGISVIGAINLLVEDSQFNGTWGTPPASGLDIEPDTADEPLRNVVFRNCTFADNHGHGILIFLRGLGTNTNAVSMLFDRCRVSSRNGAGIRIAELYDTGPRGLIEFRDCVIEGTEGYGLLVQAKSADAATVRFVRCELRDTARNNKHHGAWAPIWFDHSAGSVVKRMGGVEFVECRLSDARERPLIAVTAPSGPGQVQNITGGLRVVRPKGAPLNVGELPDGVTLRIERAP